MKERLSLIGGCICASIITIMIAIDGADAKSGSGKKAVPTKAAPEPVSCAFFAAGGGILAGLRYLINRWKLKESDCRYGEIKDGIS